MVDLPLAIFGLCDLSEKVIYQFMENNSAQLYIWRRPRDNLWLLPVSFILL